MFFILFSNIGTEIITARLLGPAGRDQLGAVILWPSYCPCWHHGDKIGVYRGRMQFSSPLVPPSLRTANPYGPDQQMKHSKYGIVNWFVRLTLEGKPLTVYGKGNQQCDYIYVNDVAKALVAIALIPGTSGEIYNVGSGIGTRFIDMANCIAQYIRDTKVIHLAWPSDPYFVETGDYITDITKIHSATGWVPKVMLDYGIKSTTDYYRSYRQHYWSGQNGSSLWHR